MHCIGTQHIETESHNETGVRSRWAVEVFAGRAPMWQVFDARPLPMCTAGPHLLHHAVSLMDIRHIGCTSSINACKQHLPLPPPPPAGALHPGKMTPIIGVARARCATPPPPPRPLGKWRWLYFALPWSDCWIMGLLGQVV